MGEHLMALDRIENISNQHQDDVVEHKTSATRTPRSDRTTVLDGGSGSGCDDIPTKKKKTRRGKPKRRNVQPYVKFSWQERKHLDDMRTNKANKARAKMIAHGQALAPYNTTQFLIEDHGYLKDIEDHLTGKIDNHSNHRQGPPRTRDSSFSVDSDVDFYSSPEDEEEFLTKEFSNTYQDIRSERLNTMTREELMQECIQMENKVEMLTKCLGSQSTKSIDENDSNNVYHEDENGIIMNYRNIKDFQLKIVKLMNENDALRRENEVLRQRQRHRRRKVTGSFSSSMCSSVDSESDSSTSSSSSSETEHVMDAEFVPSSTDIVDIQPKLNGHLTNSAPSTPASTNSIVSPRATSPTMLLFNIENHQEHSAGGGIISE